MRFEAISRIPPLKNSWQLAVGSWQYVSLSHQLKPTANCQLFSLFQGIVGRHERLLKNRQDLQDQSGFREWVKS
jgi:hypothetical protein